MRDLIVRGHQVAVALQRLLQLLDPRRQQRRAAGARLAAQRHRQLLLVAV